MAPLLQFSLVAFTSIFALVDPIAAVPTFLVMTAHTDRGPTASHCAPRVVDVLGLCCRYSLSRGR